MKQYWLAVTVLFLTMIVAGCAQQQFSAVSLPEGHSENSVVFAVQSPASPSSPLSLAVTLVPSSAKPKLGDTALVTVAVKVDDSFTYPLEDTHVVIDLPPGITLINGELEQIGTPSKESPLIMNVTVKFAHEGNWTLNSSGRWDFAGNSWYGATAQICISVSADALSLKEGSCPSQNQRDPRLNYLETESQNGTQPQSLSED